MSDTYNPFSFIFSDDPRTGALTYEQLQARRKIAAALATRNRGYPKNIGEGLTALGEGFADAAMERRLRADEKRYREETDAKLQGVLAPTVAAPATPAQPAPPPAGPGPMSPDIDPFGGGVSQAPDEASNALAMASPSDVPEEPKQKFPPLPPEVAARMPKMPIPELKRRLARAEGTISEPDPYRVVGERNLRGDYPYGKYAVMGERIPQWSKEYLGKEMTPQQFLDDDKAQEEIASARAGYYQDKYGPNGAAAAWFAGENGMNDPKRMHTLGRHVDEYVKRFNIPLVDREQVVASAARGAPPTQLASVGGMPTPDSAPADPRAAIAGAMAQGPQGPMQPQPVPQQAPVPQQRIAQAPPIGTPVPSYVSPPQGEPRSPDPTPMSDQERRMRALMAANPNDPRIQGLAVHVQQMEAQRKFNDERLKEQYKDQLQTYRTRTDPAYQQKLQDDQIKAAEAARQRQRDMARGGVPQAVLDKAVEESAKKALPIREGAIAVNQVEALLDEGMFTGTLSKVELAKAKALSAVGFPSDPRIAATEQFSAAIKPIVAAARTSLAGTANISDNDMKMAERAAGGDITLDAASIRGVMKTVRQIQMNMAMDHQKTLATAAGGDYAAESTLNGLFGMPLEIIIPKDHPTVQRLMQNPDNEHERGLFNSAFKSPGLAEKIIARNRQRQ